MLLRDLRSASFKGATFLVPSDQLDSGRNAIEHQYPDGYRYVEDNGRILPKFKISAILSEPGLPGKVRALTSALDSPGPGTLKHPWYGNRTVMVDGCYTIARSDNHSGYVEIDIPFSVTGTAIFPGLVSGIAAVVSGLAASIVSAVLSLDLTSPRSQASRSVVSGAITTFGSVLDTNLGAASESASRIIIDADRFVTGGDRFASLAEDAFRAPFDDAIYTDAALVKGYGKVLDTCLDIQADALVLGETTLDLIERKQNLLTLSRATAAAAYACFAESLAARTYNTSDEVSRDESALVDYFGRVCGGVESSLYGEEIADNLRRITSECSEVLRSAEVRLPRTSDLVGIMQPASTLAYDLYDSDAKLPQLVELNLSQTPILLAGEVTVLEDVQ